MKIASAAAVTASDMLQLLPTSVSNWSVGTLSAAVGTLLLVAPRAKALVCHILDMPLLMAQMLCKSTLKLGSAIPASL